MISIVMPAYNAEAYIEEAVNSVLRQTYQDWELLIVNDGSVDRTPAIINGFSDPRIHSFHQANNGIGKARNTALEHAKGNFLSFLDADDVLPPTSLHTRVSLLQQHPELDIADGSMIEMDKDLSTTLRIFRPRFTGLPFRELINLTGSCFGGVTWMMRWPVFPQVKFQEACTQMEDLMFMLEYSRPGRMYGHVDDPVLIYRRTGLSSTSDLQGMERSYRYVHRWLIEQAWATPMELCRFRWRSRRVMFASWLHIIRPLRALRSLFIPYP